MLRRRWLIVALCFCAFTGCVSCQSNYDYCGPMPEEGGDFMYRKNSVLGGDPSRPLADEESDQESEQNGKDENLPEPTPAPPPDEMPVPGLDLDGGMTDDDAGMAPDEESQPQAYEEELDEDAADTTDADDEQNPISTLQWHAPTAKQKTSPIKQVRFR
ncbi:MAG TPA: hypothetical protein VFI31_26680 [Pirellulales bacterium]|nr:hypothetical protein [Pirellulales bacterium]